MVKGSAHSAPFPLELRSFGGPWVDDKPVLSGIIFLNLVGGERGMHRFLCLVTRFISGLQTGAEQVVVPILIELTWSG